MPVGRLTSLAETLENAGIDPGQLRDMQAELDVIQIPARGRDRLRQAIEVRARAHWNHVKGEIHESAVLFRLVTGRVLRGESISPAQRSDARAQTIDLIKLFPASLIACTNWLLPLPGTTAFTPWLLLRLGLLPSRWKEAHLLRRLRLERERLLTTGHQMAAQSVDQLTQQLEAEADLRGTAEREASVLASWDKNKNGQWDQEEEVAYGSEVERLRRLLEREGATRRWYLMCRQEVYGPLRLGPVMTGGNIDDYLVCWDGGRWVRLSDL